VLRSKSRSLILSMIISLFRCCSIVKQLCFDGESPDENSRNLITIQVRYCSENEGQASLPLLDRSDLREQLLCRNV